MGWEGCRVFWNLSFRGSEYIGDGVAHNSIRSLLWMPLGGIRLARTRDKGALTRRLASGRVRDLVSRDFNKKTRIYFVPPLCLVSTLLLLSVTGIWATHSAIQDPRDRTLHPLSAFRIQTGVNSPGWVSGSRKMKAGMQNLINVTSERKITAINLGYPSAEIPMIQNINTYPEGGDVRDIYVAQLGLG